MSLFEGMTIEEEKILYWDRSEKFELHFGDLAVAVQNVLQSHIDSLREQPEAALKDAWAIVERYRRIAELGGFAARNEPITTKDNGKALLHSRRATKKDFESIKKHLEQAIVGLSKLHKDYGAFYEISSALFVNAGMSELPSDIYIDTYNAIIDMRNAFERALKDSSIFKDDARREDFLKEKVIETIMCVYCRRSGRDPYVGLKKGKIDHEGPFVQLTQDIFRALDVYIDSDLAPQPCGTTIKKILDKIISQP